MKQLITLLALIIISFASCTKIYELPAATTQPQTTTPDTKVAYPYMSGSGNSWTYNKSAAERIVIKIGAPFSAKDIHGNMIAYVGLDVTLDGSWVVIPTDVRITLTDSKGMIQGDETQTFGDFHKLHDVVMPIQMSDTTITIKKAVAQLLN